MNRTSRDSLGWRVHSFAATIVLFGLALPARAESSTEAAEGAEGEKTLAEAFSESTVQLGLRYRFESVDDDAIDRRGRASTLRTSLGLETGRCRGFALHLEAENVTEVGSEDSFRNAGAGSLSNGVTGRPVVADVAQTEFNQAYLSYQSERLSAEVGRRAINYADLRLVGAVAWRQNHQSFDAFTLTGRPDDRWSWGYSYIARTHRIFGDSRAMNTHLLRGEVALGDAKLRGYGLELDFDSAALAGASTRTLGLELTGGWKGGGAGPRWLYEVEFANQTDTGDNPRDLDAGYLNLMFGAKLPVVTLKLGWEVLEGSAADGQFSTPLATLHKFNGWADKFLATPEAGLEDLSLTIAFAKNAWSGAAIYHRFEAESASIDYGDELDLSLSWKSGWGQTFALKVADYAADEFSQDTTKWMLWTAYTFRG